MEIDCEFKNVDWKIEGVRYTCCVTKASIKEPNTIVKAFVGTHLPGKSDEDVEGIYFHNVIVEYFPRGLQSIFPKLIIVKIQQSSLKEISREDLVGLGELKSLYLPQNCLRSLPDDLFEGVNNLKIVTFSENNIEFLSCDLLYPLLNKNVTRVDFTGNPNMENLFYRLGDPKSVKSLKELMEAIEEKCRTPAENSNDEDLGNR
jgi:hypothetical protein